MASELTRRIEQNAQYQQLVKARNALGWRLTLLVFAAYYGFILIVAFDKSLFATPLAAGMTTTWGIPLGIGIILLTVVLTAIYVRRANRQFDPALRQILEKEVQS
ncbi:DUF485 domain-containing protein [Desulfovibrio desulfuricans]|uniref:DUF485 domain-containing protein n=1 Tax=Desulfovibrio desulfuricans TaxID=876 RepID=UPI0035B03AFE